MSQTLYIFFAGYLYTPYIIDILIWGRVIASGMANIILLAFVHYIDRRGGALSRIFSVRHLRSSGLGGLI